MGDTAYSGGVGPEMIQGWVEVNSDIIGMPLHCLFKKGQNPGGCCDFFSLKDI